jgi:hypothetical protein
VGQGLVVVVVMAFTVHFLVYATLSEYGELVGVHFNILVLEYTRKLNLFPIETSTGIKLLSN